MHKLISLFIAILLLSAPQAFALSSQWQKDGPVDARLISSLEGVGQKNIIPLGLEIKMEPGWHTYWRSPGVAGLPPQFDWSRSDNDKNNFAKATLLYPTPQRFNDQGMDTIGYQSHVIFPIDIELRHVGQPLGIDTTVNLLVCSDLCVPKTFNLSLNVPRDAAIEGAEADILAPARKLVPTQDEDTAGISIKNVSFDGTHLNVDIASTAAIVAPDLFIESNPEIPFTAPVVKLSNDQHEATLTVKPSDLKQDVSHLPGTPLTLTIIENGHALEMSTTLTVATDDGTPHISFRFALWLAIMGGFILNFMPCVLPVLSLKIMSVIGHGGGSTKAVRRSFLTTAAGIMFSFLLLAFVTVIFKSLGHTLGWGVQFQQPLFLVILILLLTVFAANMWGWFEINLPEFLNDKLAAHHPKMAGDFASGALATLLATPCTAPFLGTAVGFALASGSSLEIIAIFVALGFGMTIPYFTVALIPQISTVLPKPGAWMLKLRMLLGLALALTAVWLLWVLSMQIMTSYTLAIAACMIGIAAFLGIHTAGIIKNLVRATVVILAIIAVALSLSGDPEPDAIAKNQKLWQPFDESAIAIQVAAGQTVFVDITADWCLTCKVNKKFVLSDDDISQRLFHSDVIAMQGDWTNPDPVITNFLHKFRRYGIPFNVVYGPGAPQGITLPELLNHDVVMDAIVKASKH